MSMWLIRKVMVGSDDPGGRVDDSKRSTWLSGGDLWIDTS